MYILVCFLAYEFQNRLQSYKKCFIYATIFLQKCFVWKTNLLKKVLCTHNILPSNCIKMHIYQSFSTFQGALARQAAF